SVMLLLMPALLVIAIIGTLFAITLVFTFYPRRIRRHAREEIS
ncbi:undecaprenyl/decaprenyl-phosphate alpha-N-acetylglucosaminyl 1-phosphate transferase, partial [Burkholderia multivorans]